MSETEKWDSHLINIYESFLMNLRKFWYLLDVN